LEDRLVGRGRPEEVGGRNIAVLFEGRPQLRLNARIYKSHSYQKRKKSKAAQTKAPKRSGGCSGRRGPPFRRSGALKCRELRGKIFGAASAGEGVEVVVAVAAGVAVGHFDVRQA